MRLRISIEVDIGRDEAHSDGPPMIDESGGTLVERAHPDDVSEHAELDQRHRVGF